jgi:murein DD-endopeptidase MepM/ murein hydrolase activator NlpD
LLGPALPPGGVDPNPGRWVSGQVQQDDSLVRILGREGLTAQEAEEVVAALRPVLDLRRIQVGQQYRIHFDGQGTLATFEFAVSRVLTVKATRSSDGTLSAETIEGRTETRLIEVGGAIEQSLYAAIKGANEDASLVAFFVDVFAYDINFYIDTRKGDTYRMLVEKVYLDGQFLRYGRVLAAEYAGQVGTHHAFWWQAPGAEKGRYYRADGRSVEKTFLKSPLKFARVSSGFNPRRMHPVLHRVKGHWGVDYAAPTGTPVWAAAAGQIVYRGRRGGAGNCVILRHDNDLSTIYMHLSRFAPGHRVGQRVTQKAVIGFVGQTGLATGPHLHFGVKKNGRYVDPQRLKMEPGPPVPKQLMPTFREQTALLVAQLQEIPVEGNRKRTASADLPN